MTQQHRSAFHGRVIGDSMGTTRALAPLQERMVPGPRGEEHRRLEALWIMLSRTVWRSLAIVSAHADGSTEEVAQALAIVGKRISNGDVSAVVVQTLGPRSALALSTLANYLRGEAAAEIGTLEPIVDQPWHDRRTRHLHTPAPRQVILSIPAIVSEPFSLMVARAADSVLLGVELGRTSLKDLKRTADLVGRERIAGCCLL